MIEMSLWNRTSDACYSVDCQGRKENYPIIETAYTRDRRIAEQKRKTKDKKVKAKTNDGGGDLSRMELNKLRYQ